MNPWDLEPDKQIFGYNNHLCMIKKIPELLHLCGYVKLSVLHPMYGKDIEELNEALDVHGGITFAGDLDDSGSFWIGFDCGHSEDFIPGLQGTWDYIKKGAANFFKSTETDLKYKDSDYVKTEIMKLVDQLND